MLDQRVEVVGEKMVRAGNDVDVDFDTLLDRKPLDKLVYRFWWYSRVLLAMDDESRCRTGGKKGEVVRGCRRG